jgi:hypothetical protein
MRSSRVGEEFSRHGNLVDRSTARTRMEGSDQEAGLGNPERDPKRHTPGAGFGQIRGADLMKI